MKFFWVIDNYPRDASRQKHLPGTLVVCKVDMYGEVTLCFPTLLDQLDVLISEDKQLVLGIVRV